MNKRGRGVVGKWGRGCGRVGLVERVWRGWGGCVVGKGVVGIRGKR